MRAQKLQVAGFRNLVPQVLDLSADTTLIVGDNGHGKSNIIEALWLFSCAKSFRGAPDSEMLAFGQERAQLRFLADSEGVALNLLIEMQRGRRKQFFIGAQKLAKSADLIGSFVTVLFEPDHLSLIKGSPDRRRRALNVSLCQCSRGYTTAISEYNRILNSRGALLKNADGRPPDILQTWDEALALRGAKIILARREYVRQLEAAAAPILLELSGGAEQLGLGYKSQAEGETEGDLYESLLELLQQNRDRDLETGITNAGPHRDDMAVDINDLPARKYASSGQKRSAVLALKLAEGEVLRQNLRVCPVFLLDDVLSELDGSRREFILSRIRDFQVIITDCSTERVAMDAAVYRVTNGLASSE